MGSQTTASQRAARKFFATPRNALIIWPAGLRRTAERELQCAGLPALPLDLPGLQTGFQLVETTGRALLNHLQKLHATKEIWWEIGHKRTQNIEAIHTFLQSLPWDICFPTDAVIQVTAHCQRSSLRNSNQLRACGRSHLERHGIKTIQSSEKDHHAIPLKLILFRDILRVYFPFSMHPLHWRGYKMGKTSHAASLREDMGRALVQEFHDWLRTPDETLITKDKSSPNKQSHHLAFFPFSGSGTLFFEWMHELYGMPHCLIGSHELLLQAPWFPNQTLKNLQAKAKEELLRRMQQFALSAIAVDNTDSHCTSFRTSFQTIMDDVDPDGLANVQLDVLCQDFFSLTPSRLMQFPGLSKGSQARQTVLTFINPPFGHRLSIARARDFYGQIGAHLNILMRDNHFVFSGFIICPDQPCLHAFRRHFSGGQTENWRFRNTRVYLSGLRTEVLMFRTSETFSLS